MSDTPTLPPVMVEFAVSASAEHAFSTWVERAELWWPPGHTMSGAPVAIVVEPRAGGRIYERDAHGAELPWGEVLTWEPPTRVDYLWHMAFPRDEATRVSVTFTPDGDATVVRLVQTGFEVLGDGGPARRDRNVDGWSAVMARYRAQLDAPVPPITILPDDVRTSEHDPLTNGGH